MKVRHLNACLSRPRDPRKFLKCARPALGFGDQFGSPSVRRLTRLAMREPSVRLRSACAHADMPITAFGGEVMWRVLQRDGMKSVPQFFGFIFGQRDDCRASDLAVGGMTLSRIALGISDSGMFSGRVKFARAQEREVVTRVRKVDGHDIPTTTRSARSSATRPFGFVGLTRGFSPAWNSSKPSCAFSRSAIIRWITLRSSPRRSFGIVPASPTTTSAKLARFHKVSVALSRPRLWQRRCRIALDGGKPSLRACASKRRFRRNQLSSRPSRERAASTRRARRAGARKTLA